MRAGAATWMGAVVLLAWGAAQASDPVVYTNEDLARRFGTPPAPTSPAASSQADWEFVEGVLRREQERREADRLFELERLRAQAPPPPPPEPLYPVVWRLGFPASVWWKNVWCAYHGGKDTPGEAGLAPICRDDDRPGFGRPPER